MFFKSLPSVATKPSVKKTVVGTKRKFHLLDKRRFFQLGHFFVTSVPLTPQNHEIISIVILLGTTVIGNVMKTSSVHFLDFVPVFLFQGNTKTLKLSLLSKQRMLILTIAPTKLLKLLTKRNCVHADCGQIVVDFELGRTRHKLFNYARQIFIGTPFGEKLHQFIGNLNCEMKVNLAFVFTPKNLKEGKYR